MLRKRSTTRWYALAVAYSRCPRDALDAFLSARGTPLSRSLRCTLEALAHVQPHVGHLLDDLEAPKSVVQLVAHGDGAAEQLRRATNALAELVEHRERMERQPQTLGRALLAMLENRSFRS